MGSNSMALWDQLFSKKANQPEVERFVPHFGRFTDAYKTAEQYKAWDDSIQHFEDGDYLLALKDFFVYLANSEKNNVIQVSDTEYKILQGSKIVDIQLKNGSIQMVSKVVVTDHLHIGFMRRLLDLNYELKYVRYGLWPENVIALLFDATVENASPYKLYFALKELAIHADKQDDLLVHEFDFLNSLVSGEIYLPSTIETKVKLEFFRKAFETTYATLEHSKLKAEQYPAAGVYLLLALLYKLDFLISPEGKLLDKLEQIHKAYFLQDHKNLLQKLKSLRADITRLGQSTDEEITRELYHSAFTFGVTSPANIAAIFEILDRELHAAQWYFDNQHYEYVLAIMEYAAGICLFNYSLAAPIRDLVTIIYRISEPEFFAHVADHIPLVTGSGLPDKANIKAVLANIEKQANKEFPYLKIDARQLQYDSRAHTVYSLGKLIRQLQFQRAQ